MWKIIWTLFKKSKGDKSLKQPKLCVECKDRPAIHWTKSFCEDCFRKLLSEKLENEK
jgi:hypothetical protein